MEMGTVNVDFLDYEFNQDPYPALELIRTTGPVVYNELHDAWMVTSYRNCVRVFGNVELFNSEDLSEAIVETFGGMTMEGIDGPRHHEMRSVWARNFERATLEEMVPTIAQAVETMVLGFVERLRSGETVDAVPFMTRHIPTLVIADMLGIERSMFETFAAWSDAMGARVEGALDPTDRGKQLVKDAVAATRALNDYIAGQLDDRRKHPGTDLISKMVHSDFACRSMSQSEIVASCTQLVFAGNETTAKMMAATLVALGQHPDQRQAVIKDRSLVPSAFEEVHRWQTLTQGVQRRACSERSEIEGFRLPLGAKVVPLQGAANRDPERWEHPGEFDIFRPSKQHLGFAFGQHVCLGMNLARLEARIWLSRLLDLLPDYQLASDCIDYGTNFMLRGPVAVPLSAA